MVRGGSGQLDRGRSLLRASFRASWRVAALGFAAAVLAAVATAPGRAQSTQRPTITVSATLTAEAATQSPLEIRVGPPAALPRNSFLRIRGVPPMAALSEGHTIAPGSWAVPLAALADLRIALPADAAGKSELSILLVAIDGSVLAESKSTLVVSAARPPVGATILRAGTELPTEKRGVGVGPALQSARPMTPEDRDRAARLMQKGQEQMVEGNISSARLFYEKAADAGLAQAAMALAATFDAAELTRMSVRGIQADAKQARHWYERALQLGAPDAEQRLHRLGAN